MIGQNQSPQAQFYLALEMPIERLMQIVRGQPGPVDPSVALMAIKQKNQMKTAAQGQQAQQQLNQPKVADQVVQEASMPENQGIGKLQAPNMDGFADGGIIGMSGGGRPPVGSTDAGASWFLNLPEEIRDSSVPYYRTIPNPAYERFGKSVFPSRAAAENAYRAIESNPSVLQNASEFDKAYPAIPTVRNVSPTVARGGSNQDMAAEAERMGPPSSLKRIAPERTARTGPPAASSGITQLPVMGSEGTMYPGMETGEAPASPSPFQMPPSERATYGTQAADDYLSAMSKVSGATNPYMDKMADALKKLTPTAEERGKQQSERAGVMALKAAQSLLKSGVTAGDARGGALGQIAELTQAYGKEDREDKKALLGAEMNVLGAQAQLAQGNSKLAVDMYQHAQKLAFEGIRLDADKFFRTKELELKQQGLKADEAKEKAADLTRRYIIDVQAAWHNKHIAVLAGADKRATERATTAERNADLRAAVELMKEELKTIGLPAARKKELQDRITDLNAMLFKNLGLPSLTRGSIQIPDNAVSGKPIYDAS